MNPLLLLFVLCANQLILYAATHPIRGTIESPFADHTSQLSIVAYSRDGIIVDHSLVTHRASFNLHRLGNQDGDYVLHVVGAVEEDYDPQFVRIVDGYIRTVESQQDPLILPNPQGQGSDNRSISLTFVPARKTNYTHAKRPWRLKDLWAYRIRVLQLAAVAFVVWFPQFIRSLPKDVRDALMDEKPEDIGDVTAVFCALSGYKESTTTQAAAPTKSKR